MPTYYFVTGRERSVTWSGTTSGDSYRFYDPPPDYPYSPEYIKLPTAQVRVLGVTIRCETVYSGLYTWYNFTVDAGERVTITLPGFLGQTSQENVRTYARTEPFISNINGTWQVSATLQECVEITEIAPADADDAPPFISVRFFERLKPGSSISASATCNTLTASISATVPSSSTYEVVAALVEAYAYVVIRNTSPVNNFEGMCQLTYSSPQVSVSNPNFSQTYTETNRTRTISLTNGQAYAYAAGKAMGVFDVLPATSEGALWGEKQASLQCRVLAMQDSYPNTLVARVREKKNTWTDVTLNSGVGTLTIAQRKWNILSVLYGSPSDYSIDEYATVRAFLTSSSLQAIDEDTTATRLYGHGWVYSGVSFQHDTRYVLDTCDNVSDSQREWVSVQDCNVSAISNYILVTPTGSAPVVRRTCLSPPREYWNTYAFLRLYVMADIPDATLTVIIGNKRYTTSTRAPANTWTEIYIDLCCPTNATAPYDLQNTKYPDGRLDGDYWGITSASTLRFEFDNATWRIGEISLDVAPWSERQAGYNVPNHSLTVCFSRGWWQDTGRGYEVRRLITGQSDGKLALEIEDVRRMPDDTFSMLNIANIVNLISSSDSDGAALWPGWHCNYTCPPPTSIPNNYLPLSDYYLTASRPASWLGGGGLVIHANRWESYAGRVQLPSGTSISVPIQVLYDEIDWYPGCKDPWGLDGSGTNDTLRILFGTVLRSRAYGIVIHGRDKARVDEGGVALQRVNVIESGGIADLQPWQGYFETGEPFAKGQHTYKLQVYVPSTTGYETQRQYYTRLPIRTVTTVSPVIIPLRYYATCNFACTRVVEAYYDRQNDRMFLQWSGMGYSIPFSSAVICPLALSSSENPVHISLISSDKTYLTVLDTQPSESPPGVKTSVYRIREGFSTLELTAVTPENAIPPLMCFGYILLLPCYVKIEPEAEYRAVVASGTGLLSGVYRFPELIKAIRSGENIQPLLRIVPESLPSWSPTQPFPFWLHRWHWNLYAHDFVLVPTSSSEAVICEIVPASSDPSSERKLIPAYTLARPNDVMNVKARLWATEGRFLVVEEKTGGSTLKCTEGQSARATTTDAVGVTLTYSNVTQFDASIIVAEDWWAVRGWDLLPDREWAILMVGYQNTNDGTLHTTIWRWGNRSIWPFILIRKV